MREERSLQVLCCVVLWQRAFDSGDCAAPKAGLLPESEKLKFDAVPWERLRDGERGALQELGRLWDLRGLFFRDFLA